MTKPNVSGSLLVSVGDHSQHRLLLWAVLPLVHHPEHEISEYTLTINWVWSNISPRLQKLLFSTAAFACYPPFSPVWRSTNSAPRFRHVPAGLLQLAVSGAAGMWYQSTTVCSECSWTTVRWRIQIWFCGSCVARWSQLAASQAENHFQGRGVRIQGHPWPCASLLEGTVSSRVKCSGIESKQICILWGLHRSTRNKEPHLPSTKFCSGGTYLVELLPSGNPQLQFHANFPFQT